MTTRALDPARPDAPAPTRGAEPVLSGALAFCAGIGVAPAVFAHPWGWAGGVALLAALAVAARRSGPMRPWQRPAGRLALFAAVGVARAWGTQGVPAVDPFAAFHGAEGVLRGVVCDPEVRTAHAWRLTVEVHRGVVGSTFIDGTGRGRVLVVVPQTDGAPSPAHWGQEVVVSGRLEPPGAAGNAEALRGPSPRSRFDLRAWLAARRISCLVRVRHAGKVGVVGPGGLPPIQALAARWRRAAEVVIESSLPPADAALLEGVLLAEARGVPDDVVQALRDTGTYHVIVTAGVHVAFLTSGCVRVLGALGLGGRHAALLTLPMLVVFAWMAGASASIVRASIMGGLGLVALASGRLVSGRRSLGLAILAMTVWAPRLVEEAGFQMSVACVLGIVTLTPGIARRLSRLPTLLRQPLAVSLATQLMIAPLTAYYFGEVSLLGVAANLVVVPLCEGLLAIGFGLLALEGVGEWLHLQGLCRALGRPLVGSAELACGAVVTVARGFQAIPLCVVQVPPMERLELVLGYVAVMLVALRLRHDGEQGRGSTDPTMTMNGYTA